MRFIYLLYCALFFLPFESLPYSKYGLPDYCSVSLLLIIIFFLVNIDLILKKGIRKKDFSIIAIISILLIISLLKGNLVYNDLIGFKKALFSMATFIPVLLVTRFMINQNNIRINKNIVRCIFIGYSLSLFIGVMQVFTCYFNIHFMDSLYSFIVKNPQYVVEQHRIMFTFSEPSAISVNLFLVLFPLVKFLDDFQRRKYKIFLTAWIFVSILSFSVTYYILMAVYCITYYFSNKKMTTKRLLGMLVIGVTIVMCFVMLNSGSLKSFNNVYLTRIDDLYNVMKSGNGLSIANVSGDMSTTTRLAYYKIGAMGFLHHPLLGYGFGYGKECFNDYFGILSNSIQSNAELQYYLQNSNYIFLGGFYIDCLACMGLLGLLFIYMFLKEYLVVSKVSLCEKIVFIFLLSQSNLFGSIILVYYWTICTSADKIIYPKKRSKA